MQLLAHLQSGHIKATLFSHFLQISVRHADWTEEEVEFVHHVPRRARHVQVPGGR